MSFQLLKQDVLFYQRFLKSNGFYEGELDGIWGTKTDEADASFFAESTSIADQLGTFDARSESNITTLIPKAQIEARKFLKIALDGNKDVRIISGTRTYEEQDALFAQGRTKLGKIITKARGGESNHNFGIAWDIGLFDNGAYIENDDDYIALAHAVLPNINSLEWGGDWHSFKDFPHYQLKAVSDSVAAIRQLFENGEVFV